MLNKYETVIILHKFGNAKQIRNICENIYIGRFHNNPSTRSCNNFSKKRLTGICNICQST